MPKNPHANFTPNFDGYSGQEPFRFWCQLALPLTYDDSLSYYELLNKVVNYLNHVIADVSAVEDNVGKLRDAFVELQDYVNEYFDELDVEQELRNVLDAMALDGSFAEILSPVVAEQIGEVVAEQIDNVVSEQIDGSVAEQIDDVVENQLPEAVGDSVTDWLNENVNPVGSAVTVDSSLSIAGSAADAKVTGEKIGNLNDGINVIISDSDEFDYSQIDANDLDKFSISSSGTYTLAGASSTRSYTIPLNSNMKRVRITANSIKNAIVAFLDTYVENPSAGDSVDFSDGFDSRITITAGTSKEFFIEDSMNYLFALIYDSSANDCTPIVYIDYIDTDKTLTGENVPAEAKAVGDAISELNSSIGNIDEKYESAIWNNRDDEYTPHVLVYYGVGTTVTNVITDLPIDSWCYAEWEYLKNSFVGLNAPDMGFEDTTYVKIEKRAVTNVGTVFEIDIIANASGRKNFKCIYNTSNNSARWFYPDSTLTLDKVAGDAKVIGDRFAGIDSIVNSDLYSIIHSFAKDVVIDYALIWATDNYIWKKQNGATQATSCGFKVPKGAIKAKVTPIHGGASVISFMKTFCPVNNGVPDYSDDWTRTRITEYTEYNLKEDCKYMFVSVTASDGTSNIPSVEFVCVRANDNDEILESYDNDTLDETGKHDRSLEIMMMLNERGSCKLGEGIFYVSGIIMPDKSLLIGNGKNTDIRLLASVNSGSAILMGKECTVKDLRVSGKYDRIENPTTGTRNGIEFTGTSMLPGCIENCCVWRFEGSGIYLHNTSEDTYRCLTISNCWIYNNGIGIDITNVSEFHKITNCSIERNYIGYRNRGGNNDISNCGIDSNEIGILINEVDSDNSGHGIINGCSVNHSGGNSGYGLIIEGGSGRMLVTGCNFYYSKIKLDNTNGNAIDGCGFKSTAIEISEPGCSLISNCMFDSLQSPPFTYTNNSDAKVINCYDRNGTVYSR